MQTRQQQNLTRQSPQSVTGAEPVSATASIVSLEPGLFSVRVGAVSAAPAAIGPLSAPLVQVSGFPSSGLADVELLGPTGPGEAWFDGEGGLVVVRAPAEGGAIAITAFAPAGSEPALPEVEIERLTGDLDDREIETEILLHVERLGDRRFSGQEWTGERGQRLRVEGFAITPLGGMSSRDLEYQGFQLGGAETGWLGGDQFCGSRGRRTPLTGFAIRPAPHARERFDIVYSGAFISGGTTGPLRNGERCRSAQPDDPLEAMNIRIVQHEAAAPADPGRRAAAVSRIDSLSEGLFALSVAAAAAGVSTKVSAAPVPDEETVEVAITSGAAPGWVDDAGGTVIVKVAAGGGTVVATTYGLAKEAPAPQLTIVRLDRAPEAAPPPNPPPPREPAPAAPREAEIEVALHVERQGDQRSLAHGWVGNLGQRLRIEAFGLRPLGTIAPGDIEYMSFGPGGLQTPWVTDGKLCGSRGRGMPLTGFAIRLKPELQDRFDVIYEGSFFDTGASALCRNGEPCRGSAADDPLEAVSLRVVERR